MGAIAAAGDLTVPAFDPLSLPWTHAYWAEGPAMAALGYSNGASVDLWPDEIGSADLTQATSARRPKFRAAYAALNNRPAIDNAVADSNGLAGLGGSFTSSLAQPCEVVVVFRSEADPSGAQMIVSDNIATLRVLRFFASPTNYGGSWGGTVVRGGTPDTSAHFARIRGDSTDEWFIDESSVASGNAGTTNLGSFRAFGDAGSAMQGAIAFLAVAKPVLSAPDIAALHTWAQDLYSTP
jgi:hypothetical protein